jgi:DNA-directed RNA polymerase subunit M
MVCRINKIIYVGDKMFCPKCGSIMLPKKEGNKTVVKCSCGYKKEDKDAGMIREEILDKGKSVEVVDTAHDMKAMPKMKVDCPKCHNTEAGFWEVQTRASDEPATKFMKCVKCKHIWRDYN